jgi:hypothetical protein
LSIDFWALPNRDFTINAPDKQSSLKRAPTRKEMMMNNQNFATLETATTHWPEQAFPPLELVTRPTVNTEAAAFYLNRAPQTLRKWACLENGPLRPIRVYGRLAWKISDIRALLA